MAASVETSAGARAKYEPVIGLEVHVQLLTASKIFCSCSTRFGDLPNSNVCPVCPGLPKGYQISQYDKPLAEHGFIEIETGTPRTPNPKRIGITRVHLEEDAGKSLHEGFAGAGEQTAIDLNRSGVPLIEIVSEPDI